jgi:Beta/Gamma crystallin
MQVPYPGGTLMITRNLLAGVAALAALTTAAAAQYYPSERPYREGPREYRDGPYRDGPREYRERPYRPEPRQQFFGCVVYEHINFGGASLAVGPGQTPFVGQGWNDRVSSINCSPGCRLAAYEHAGYQGNRQVFAGSTPFVGQYWNDRISAAEVRCR